MVERERGKAVVDCPGAVPALRAQAVVAFHVSLMITTRWPEICSNRADLSGGARTGGASAGARPVIG
jgi:hypothetical protein